MSPRPRSAAAGPPPRSSGAPALRWLPGRGGGLGAWVATPGGAPAGPPLVAVHGIGRNARDQARAYAAAAARQGRAVIAPMFGPDAWPAYQRAVFQGRADLALIELMEALRIGGLWRGEPFALAGYSGGAQFAHRFAMLHPQLVESLSVISAGWYTFPDAAAFPCGLGRRARGTQWGPRLAARLDRFLRLPMRVCVGARDAQPDPNTRSGPEIDAQQGPHRRERARRWTEAVNAAAAARGRPPPATLHVLAGAGHDFGECLAAGLPEIVAPPPRAPLHEAAYRPAPEACPDAQGRARPAVCPDPACAALFRDRAVPPVASSLPTPACGESR